MADDNVPKPTEEFVLINRRVRAGPLPAPDDFAAYQHILPGAADRIMSMAEQAQTHMIGMERTQADFSGMALRAEQRMQLRGQIFGFVLVMTLVISGASLLALDKDAIGLASIIGAAATVVGQFLLRKKQQKGG